MDNLIEMSIISLLLYVQRQQVDDDDVGHYCRRLFDVYFVLFDESTLIGPSRIGSINIDIDRATVVLVQHSWRV